MLCVTGLEGLEQQARGQRAGRWGLGAGQRREWGAAACGCGVSLGGMKRFWSQVVVRLTQQCTCKNCCIRHFQVAFMVYELYLSLKNKKQVPVVAQRK